MAAILHDPDVLIMDEPFTGLDPINVRLLKEAFLAMRDRGKTLIFSTHQMEQVEELCESIAIVDRGRVVVSGAVRDVKRAMGRQVVRLATDGDGHGVEWLSTLPGVTLTAEREDFVELRVPAEQDPGHDPAHGPRARGQGHPLRDRRAVARGGLRRARRAARRG